MEVHGKGWRPRQLSENESKQNSVKGFVLTYPQYLCGYGGVPHTRSSHPPLMDWLATGADVRLKLSQTQFPNISLDFLLCSVRQTFTAKLLFSESSNNSLYFVLDADDLPPDPPSPPWNLLCTVTNCSNLLRKRLFWKSFLLHKSGLIYSD